MRWNKIVVFGAALASAASIGFVAGAADKKAGVMWAPAEMTWGPLDPGSPLQAVKLWGDRAKGEYAMLLKLPAGAQAGFHAHTKDYYAVSVQGQWFHTFEGGQPKELPVGSYVYQPGKQWHDDSCGPGADCILFIHQHGKGDFIPMPAPK